MSAGTRFRNSLSLPSDRRPGELDTGCDEYLMLERLRGHAKLSVRTLRNYLNLPPAAAGLEPFGGSPLLHRQAAEQAGRPVVPPPRRPAPSRRPARPSLSWTAFLMVCFGGGLR